MVGAVSRVATVVATAPLSAKALGDLGQKWLVDYLGEGGVPQRIFNTTLGRRVVDYLFNGTAYEVKNGFVRMTSAFMRQALKDSELLSTGEVSRVVWHFLQGASYEVLNFLAEHGIEWVNHGAK